MPPKCRDATTLNPDDRFNNGLPRRLKWQDALSNRYRPRSMQEWSLHFDLIPEDEDAELERLRSGICGIRLAN